jgi:hypothetical protein
MLAELNTDFSKGKLYLKDGPKKTFAVSHPLDQLLVINLLSLGRGLLVHACGIDANGRGYVFLGASREGKSTTARLWLREVNPPPPPFNSPLSKGDTPPILPLARGGEGGVKGELGGIMTGVKILSDDRLIIRKINGIFYAYGTPWHGDVEVANPGRVKIEEIFFLGHSKKNYIKPLSPMDAATRMFVRCFPTFWDKEGMEFTLGFIDEIVKKIPCYEFGFVPDKSAVEFVRGMR